MGDLSFDPTAAGRGDDKRLQLKIDRPPKLACDGIARFRHRSGPPTPNKRFFFENNKCAAATEEQNDDHGDDHPLRPKHASVRRLSNMSIPWPGEPQWLPRLVEYTNALASLDKPDLRHRHSGTF